MCQKCKITAGLFSLLLFFVSFAESETADTIVETAVVSTDTFFVYGNHSYGILNLPITPNGIPYIINGKIENDSKKILLFAGEHQVYWDGGIDYEPIDTILEVNVGEIRNVVFNFIERKSTIFLEAEPEEAKIFLDGNLSGVGVLFGNLRPGAHRITVSAQGYHTSNQDILVLPNHLVKMNVKLTQIPDRDGDGFPDSIDVCPDVFGIFDGCPQYKKGKELKKLSDFWWNYLRTQPLTIEVLGLAVQYRIPVANEKFRNLISLFNDGVPIGTNYRGFTAFNKLWIAKSFWIISAEYGQGFAGLKYKKPYPIEIDDYTLMYKEYREINPEITINTYSGQFGFRSGNKNLTIAILTGFQSEKITVSGVTKKDENGKEYYSSFSKQNNSWITTARAVVSPKGEIFHPAIFGEISLTPVSSYYVTSWVGLRAGILIPWRLEKSAKNRESKD